MKLLSMFLIPITAGLLTAAEMTVQEAQELLKAKGYYVGEVDGLNGPRTEAAISAFQKDQGLPVTGKLDEKTAKQLNGSMPGEAVGAVKGAGKEATSSAASESKSAFGEVKSALGFGKKKEEKKPDEKKPDEKKKDVKQQ